jgi:carboxymethylenebutenolidase
LSSTPLRSLAVLLCAVSGVGGNPRHKTAILQSRGVRIAIDEYLSRVATKDAAAVILLYGSGGVRSSALPYDGQARLFAAGGRSVYLPHYLDVTRGSTREPELHYGMWAMAVRDVLEYIRGRTGIPPGRMAMVGHSLGASVALSAAALEPHLAGIVVWSGSLPDAYRGVQTLPPLLILHGGRDPVIPDFNARQLATVCTLRQFPCELRIYPDEGHAFSAAGIARADRQIQAFLDRVLPVR